ncbi:MAG: protein kinase [Sandaracinus sp.]
MGLRCDQCKTENADGARFCAKCGAALIVPREKDPLLGTVIAGRFRVLSVLGEGGMGRVYRGEQQMGTTSRAVAIKVLTTSPTDEKAVARFHRECATVVSLHHPNTIRFYDFGTLPDGRLYIAMELVEGRSLAKAIAEGPLPYAVVDRLVIEIGGALAEAHRRGIVHRDLKPDNVLLAQHGEEGEHAKVLDFGIAKNAREGDAEITAAGTIVGTPAYMSPEQLSGKDVDERSDVYALGLMTYEMLTGARPFSGCTTPLEWATAHLTKTPRPFDEFPSTRVLPIEKQAAILHALAKEPEDRTTSALRFVEELTGTVRTSQPATRSSERAPPTGDAPTVAARTPRASVGTGANITLPPSRGRLALYAVGAVAMTAVGAVAMASVLGPRPPDATTLRPTTVDAGVPPDVGSDAGPRIEWARVLTASSGADTETFALGPPDGRCAVIRFGGKLLFELPPEVAHTTGGTEAPDLEIVVRDATSPYRVEVGLERHTDTYTTIASDIVGVTPLDVDQFDVHEFRYIRVKNASRSSVVCVDAVGVFVDR